jgi:hypothetical protein
MVWGSEPPIFSIGCEPPTTDGDSGFSVLFEDAPEPCELEGKPPDLSGADGVSVWCLGCLIEEHPEIGRGLDLAREYGAADLDDDEWVGRRLEPLNP